MHAGENMKLADVLLALLTGLSWLQSIFVPIAKHIWLNCKVYFSYTSCTLARIWNVLLVLLTGLTSWLRPPPVASRRCPKHQLELSLSRIKSYLIPVSTLQRHRQQRQQQQQWRRQQWQRQQHWHKWPNDLRQGPKHDRPLTLGSVSKLKSRLGLSLTSMCTCL